MVFLSSKLPMFSTTDSKRKMVVGGMREEKERKRKKIKGRRNTGEKTVDHLASSGAVLWPFREFYEGKRGNFYRNLTGCFSHALGSSFLCHPDVIQIKAFNMHTSEILYGLGRYCSKVMVICKNHLCVQDFPVLKWTDTGKFQVWVYKQASFMFTTPLISDRFCWREDLRLCFFLDDCG